MSTIWGIAVGCILITGAVMCRVYSRRRRRGARLVAQREIARRAESEHALYLQGDPRGIYGSYLPPSEFMERADSRKPCCEKPGCLGTYVPDEKVIGYHSGEHWHIRGAGIELRLDQQRLEFDWRRR